MKPIPICKPQLPKAEKLLPYLNRIDKSRWYTNFGGLVREYEERLSNHFGGYVVATSSGTQGLVATIKAMNLPHGRIACPSFTFCATPAAIVSAGYTPFFVDVDQDWWMADKSNFHSIGVAPFGYPISGEYDIIDAAAGFDTVEPRDTPQIISSHATKSFSTGEGGMVLSKNKHLIDEIRTVINHGISPERTVSVCGINAKMSEYHAAVGLASLDEWPEKREKWMQVGSWYGRGEFAVSTNIVELNVLAKPVAEKLTKAGIDTRLSWYNCHRLEAYKDFPRRELPVTELLIDTTIALPFYCDMKKKDVDYILEHIDMYRSDK